MRGGLGARGALLVALACAPTEAAALPAVGGRDGLGAVEAGPGPPYGPGVISCTGLGAGTAGHGIRGWTPAPAAVRMDVVFALDSTGSMGAYLEGVKELIRATLRDIRACVPAPDLRVGLLTYRDTGDDYVTKHIPLTRDLERVDLFLTRIEAGGGADWREHVARALHVVVHRLGWDLDPRTRRHLFLLGDAPGHTDYADGYDADAEARTAGERGIAIHAFALVSDAELEEQWARLAALSGGTFRRSPVAPRSALLPPSLLPEGAIGPFDLTKESELRRRRKFIEGLLRDGEPAPKALPRERQSGD